MTLLSRLPHVSNNQKRCETMKRVGKVPTIAVLAAMLVSMNRRPPTRSFSLGATTMLKGGAEAGRFISAQEN